MNRARALLFATVLVYGGCTRPEPPTITPISGRVTQISPSGITVTAKLEGYNPNGFHIRVKSATTHLVLDSTYDVGTMTLQYPVDLPSQKRQTFEIPVSLNWRDVLTLVPMALSNRDVPYVADGTIQVSAASIDLEVPFKVTGFVTHKQLVEAVGRSVPKIQGLPLPF
jgi:LEA14-like dessication related protein